MVKKNLNPSASVSPEVKSPQARAQALLPLGLPSLLGPTSCSGCISLLELRKGFEPLLTGPQLTTESALMQSTIIIFLMVKLIERKKHKMENE